MLRALSFIGLSVFAAITHAQTLQATLVVSGLTQPVAVVQDPTDPAVKFVVQQSGAIRVIVNGILQATPFLSLSVLTGSERGLLGLCFDPDYATNGHFFVHYTRAGVYMQLSRFTRSANPLVADPGSEFRILRTLRPFTNHNSGAIEFGPDGLLYVPTGDGGSSGDPGNRAQNPNELLGKMLRINPDIDDFPTDVEANYGIPVDNPFVDNVPITARGEIWSFGLRNTWRFSFDNPSWLGTGAMLIGDVGQDAWEEFNYEPAGQGGRNYGWSRFEGFADFNTSRTLAYQPHQPPIHTYSHTAGRSITGGYVYRGLQLGPAYFGRYFFADYVLGKVWSAQLIIDSATGEATLGGITEHTADFAGQLGSVSSFGVDTQGELLAVRYSGAVYSLSRPNTTWLAGVGRYEGIISSGQVRSLIVQDGKFLEIEPFTPFFSTTKRTGLVVNSKTNLVGGTQLTCTFKTRANQPVPIQSELFVKNWTTGAYDSMGTYTTTGTLNTFTFSTNLADHVEPGTGNIEFRFGTSVSGLLLTPVLKIQYDEVVPTVN